MKNYVGNNLQIRGAEALVLQGGKGNGMHFLYVRNGLGLEAWVSLDRAGDISRLNFKGDNMGYFSPCGYVAPTYYEKEGTGFLKSFTAGFFTTCGLTAVGAPCVDEDGEAPMHGTISNTPAELLAVEEDNDCLTVKLRVIDAVIFGKKIVLNRIYSFSYKENIFSVEDTVTNEGDTAIPYMIMYHCNMGYPLLSENSILKIPNKSVNPRDREAEKYIDTALKMEKPQACFAERCYYYDVLENNNLATVGIYNEDIAKGVILNYKKDTLPCFTEWKMMGKRDYVLGLEPGNCTPDGRDVLRKKGTLKFLQPEQSCTTTVEFKFINNIEAFEKAF